MQKLLESKYALTDEEHLTPKQMHDFFPSSDTEIEMNEIGPSSSIAENKSAFFNPSKASIGINTRKFFIAYYKEQNDTNKLKELIMTGDLTLNEFMFLTADEDKFIKKILDLLINQIDGISKIYEFLCSEKLIKPLKRIDYYHPTPKNCDDYSSLDDYWMGNPSERLKLFIIEYLANYPGFRSQLLNHIVKLPNSVTLIDHLEAALCDDPGPQNLLGDVFYAALSTSTYGPKSEGPTIYNSSILEALFLHYGHLKSTHNSPHLNLHRPPQKLFESKRNIFASN